MPADPIFLSYDRTALDLQYNNQLRVARLCRPRRALAEGKRARACCPAGRARRRLRPSPTRYLILHAGAGRPPGTGAVFYSRGYWRSFKAADFAFVPSAWPGRAARRHRQLRAGADGAHRRTCAPVPRRAGLGPRQHRALRRRSQPYLRLRPSAAATCGGAGGHGGERIRARSCRAASPSAGSSISSRFRPLLSAGDAAADAGGGGGQQPGAPAADGSQAR